MPSSADIVVLDHHLDRRRLLLPWPRRRRPTRRLRGERLAFVLLGLLVLAALVGPWLSPYRTDVPSGEPYLPPLSPGHLAGTDNLGLDILTRVLAGTRISLFAGVVVTAVAAVIGLVIGTVAGYVGGWWDGLLMRLTDLFLAFPATIVAMAIVSGLGPSLQSSMIGITVVWWPLYARLVRGEVRRARTSLHVEAARTSGTTGWRLLTRHVVPTVLPTVLVTASLDIGAVVMTLAALAFIGLGSPAPSPELGLMASGGMEYVLSAWWVPVIPGVAVGLVALLFNYVGDSVRIMLRAKGA